MSANGVLGSLCFPSFPSFCGQLFARTKDKDVALAMVRAYNDWHIDEWCGTYPGRFIPLSIPPIWDPALMADEVHRVAAKGCRAVTFSENPEKLGWPSYHSDHWDPFWKAVSDEGTIVCLHIGSSSQLTITSIEAPINVMISLQPMNIVQAAADVLFSPMIRKFPDVTIALSEGGIGWIPYFLERIDHTYKVHKAWTFADFGGKLPSEVFMERMILCFIEDDFGARQAREIGTDRICIETDYPHSDAVWPNAPERMMEAFAPTDLTDDEINQITHLNAMKFFRYDPFSIRPREKCTAGALRAEAEGHDISIVAKGRRVEHDAPTKVSVFGS
jgi:predicted TIM-barrel fold metal-dependent hydrolase